ncbi:MAG: hypothetical protein K6B68_17905 [Eubacterium sp.]|nr:hypothetical protein [Eubacterium sp.]
MNRRKCKEYENIKNLGDIFRYAYEHDFYYYSLSNDDEDPYGVYLTDESEGSDALRTVYMCMLEKGLIATGKERYDFEYALRWFSSDETLYRAELVLPFLKLTLFKNLGLIDIDPDLYSDFFDEYEQENPDDFDPFDNNLSNSYAAYIDTVNIDPIVDYLNSFTVNEVIKENASDIFYTLNNYGNISGHSLIYYSDESGKLVPESHRFDHVFKLDLYATEKQSIIELDSDIEYQFGHTDGGSWVMYGKKAKTLDHEDTEENESENICRNIKLISLNAETGDKIEYKGVVVAYNNQDKVIIQRGNILYKVEGNCIEEIRNLGKREYVKWDNDEYLKISAYSKLKEELVIHPILRGAFVPFRISYEGEYIGMDTSASQYIWWSILSMDYFNAKSQDLPYEIFCHGLNERYESDKKFKKFMLDKCSINEIMSFENKMYKRNKKLIKSMKPIFLLVTALSYAVDKDADISSLLCNIRKDFLNSQKSYWDDIIDMKYEHADKEDEDIVEKDLLGQRFCKDFVISYRYNSFVSQEYVEDVIVRYGTHHMKDYVKKLWFKDSPSLIN